MTPADELYAQLLKISMGINPFASMEDRVRSCTIEGKVGAPMTWDYTWDYIYDSGEKIYVTEKGRKWMRKYEKSRAKPPPS